MSDNKNEIFVASKGVVSRRNQDGTFILMKMEDSGSFFKITGLATAVWAELETPKDVTELGNRFHSPVAVGEFISQLSNAGLIEPAPAATPFKGQAMQDDTGDFGGLKEYNLEEIETEVLNESVYLDVFAGSDLRLKQDVEPIRDALQKVGSLNGITYRWNPDTAVGADAVRHAGVIAQDVAAAMPELVRRDESRGMLAVEYSKMNSYLVEAIKELHALVLKQNERLSQLEKRIQ